MNFPSWRPSYTPPSAITLLINALATYRLTKLIKDDKITEDLRNWVYAKYGEPSDHKLSYLTTCPWCLSFYFGIAVSISRIVVPKAAGSFLEAMALSAITGIIAEREDT